MLKQSQGNYVRKLGGADAHSLHVSMQLPIIRHREALHYVAGALH